MDYLVGEGIDASRLQATGFGKSEPTAPDDTPEGRQKNRRGIAVLRWPSP
jgi:OmpA-OmpF porin, OOP family